MTDSSNTPSVLHTCGKCDGKGRLDWTSQDDGVCYWCRGAGKLATLPADAIESACVAAGNCANIASQGVAMGRTDYARSYARSAAAELLKVGTANARTVLASVLAGRVADSYDIEGADQWGWLQLTPTQARAVYSLIIEEGRKLRAA